MLPKRDTHNATSIKSPTDISSSAHGKISKTDDIPFKETEIIFFLKKTVFHHTRMDKNNREKTRKSISMWRLNNKLLMNTSKKKSQVKLRTLEMDENKTVSPKQGVWTT